MVYEVTYTIDDKQGNPIRYRDIYDLAVNIDVIRKSLESRGAKSICINKKRTCELKY